MKRALHTTIVAFLAVAVWSQAALADVARHERVEVKPFKEKGDEGVLIKLTLRPEGYARVRVGLAPAGIRAKDHRAAASDFNVGHLLHQFTEINFDTQDPKPVELKVLYKDAPKIKAGDKFEIVSTFNNDATNKNYWHVYGMTGAGGQPAVYDAPGTPPAAPAPAAAPAAQRKAKINTIKRSSSRASKRSTTGAKTAKPSKAPAKAKAKPARAR